MHLLPSLSGDSHLLHFPAMDATLIRKMTGQILKNTLPNTTQTISIEHKILLMS